MKKTASDSRKFNFHNVS